MKKLILIALLAGVQLFAVAQTPVRPNILGIDHVSFYTTAPDGVKKLYGDVLGLASADPVEPGETLRFIVGKQWVGYSPAPDPNSTDRMNHIAFATDNIVALRRYLTEKGIKATQIEGRSDHSLSLMVNDPEGHRIEFVEKNSQGRTAKDFRDLCTDAGCRVSHHMIHAGVTVYHRDAEDHFYRDILSFRPYWHGGMKEGETDWVALQVPDGTDWIEYMLNQPVHMDLQTSGVMHHISLGVADMKQAQTLLESHGWKPHGDEHAQMGRDGKWQLNLYDPDFTRIELMEFKPAQKPCCSDFTGPHPTE
jgi:catechol 2,3-dioxygenase-like lactoylglutathione lyase family enzyme